MDPTTTAIGTWSGGRFMHFGEPLADQRLHALLRPGEGIDTRDHGRCLRRWRGRPRARRRARGLRPGWLLPDRRGRTRLLRGIARGRKGLSPLHRPAPARRARICRLSAHGGRAQPRALRGRPLRRAAAAQSGPHRLFKPGGVGGDAGGTRRGARANAGGGARSRERFHARPDRLHGAVLRADRLGDDHPQPARAVARRARARRRCRAAT